MAFDKNKILHDTITDLFRIAARDGIITETEKNIIDQVEIDVKKYGNALDFALKDDVIDKTEHDVLTILADEIVANAERTAMADGVYSRNERDLIVKLNKIIHTHYEL
jgi:hypothetical protein